jgi:molybdenum cofactor biosynthesis enzyme MoaA
MKTYPKTKNESWVCQCKVGWIIPHEYQFCTACTTWRKFNKREVKYGKQELLAFTPPYIFNI